MFSFFRNNKGAVLAALCAVFVVVGALAMNGCSLGSFIKHDVPKEMQKFNNGEPKVNLDDAPFVLEEYIASCERNLRKFSESNEKAHLIHDFVNSALTIGMEELGNSPIPGATIFSGVLLGVAGLMTRKPGTATEVAKAKMASFNAGQNKALEQAKLLVGPEQMRALVEALKKAVKE